LTRSSFCFLNIPICPMSSNSLSTIIDPLWTLPIHSLMFSDILRPYPDLRSPPFVRFPRCTSFGWLLLTESSPCHWEGALRWVITGKVAHDEDKGVLDGPDDSDEKVRINRAKNLKVYHANEFMSLFKWCWSKHCIY
jgi:hypothetical protein